MRRQTGAWLAALLLVISLVTLPPQAVAAQRDAPEGQIAFVEDGNIWRWTPDGVEQIIEDGSALDPTWSPDGERLLYVRDGGSYSNLVLVEVESGRVTRLTDNESDAEEGSPEYVSGSAWAIDPFWSDAGIVCFISDAGSETRQMELWILDPESRSAYRAATDGGDAGSIEQVTVDADATWAVYTVFAAGGAEGGTTYIALRDINLGTTYPIIEGPRGAYDAAISPDAAWIVASIRDEQGMSDLWLFERETDELTRLTTGAEASNAVWSPDGTWLAYMRRAEDGFEIWAMPFDRERGEPAGDPRKLVDARAIDAPSGLAWGEPPRR